MPRSRPATTGYAQIAQAEEFSDDEDEDPLAASHASLQPANAPRYTSISQPRPHGGMYTDGYSSPTNHRKPGHRRRRSRMGSNASGVDIKAINARLERWADEIASKFKINKVKGKSLREEKLEIQHSVFQAPDGIRPATADTLASEPDHGRMTKLEFDDVVESVRTAIEQGIHPKMISQGSSGSYFARNSDGKVVGVFKPKDEEPYAAGNPKWNKWIHRNLFPCFFGRACLIPNLSYVSEAAAYTLDCRLRTNLVPYTDIVHLSSKSFHYDFWIAESLIGKNKRGWRETCRPSSSKSDDGNEGAEASSPTGSGDDNQNRRFVWTDALQQAFREELEKLVILDYIMRNTDRGLDNWMIKIDWENQGVSIVSDPPQMKTNSGSEQSPRVISTSDNISMSHLPAYPYRSQEPMEATSRSATPSGIAAPTISIGAIDNSLSWPWKHPDAWRSFSLWLVILTCIADCQDADFQERMFARQIAVMKGQAWNVVETLKTADHGPLELTRRARVCVWDDLVDIPVAVPMRVPSAEMRRRNDLRSSLDEEMDISAANATAPPPPDLLGLASPSMELPNPNRFELASPRFSEDASPEFESAQPSAAFANSGFSRDNTSKDGVRFSDRPHQHSRNPRRFSFGSRSRGAVQTLYDGDDLEGDLGYAAAEGMEGHQRKVIVERLETVKSKKSGFHLVLMRIWSHSERNKRICTFILYLGRWRMILQGGVKIFSRYRSSGTIIIWEGLKG
ncbi:hypothetical protein EYC84_005477 [Monilinia fructicola]|uniref:Phosphatidylinositol 4-kinase n=1 Tax=Monilinia fructicola TaxID=38448 RepID=A0A5M9K528_MONFR|nr:hypothetical protein EYC84_005477 [Monilinia fructicola]